MLNFRKVFSLLSMRSLYKVQTTFEIDLFLIFNYRQHDFFCFHGQLVSLCYSLQGLSSCKMERRHKIWFTHQGTEAYICESCHVFFCLIFWSLWQVCQYETKKDGYSNWTLNCIYFGVWSLLNNSLSWTVDQPSLRNTELGK